MAASRIEAARSRFPARRIRLGEQRQVVRPARLRAVRVEALERRLDHRDALGGPLLPARPSDEHLGPVAVVAESVPLAQRHGRFRALEHALGIAAHLVEQRRVCERERLAVQVIQPPRERDRLRRRAHTAALSSPSSQSVCEYQACAKTPRSDPERGALRMPLVVCRQRRLEVVPRGVELAHARQRAAHRMMRLAAARRIGHAARERLLRYLARALQVAEHEAKRERHPQPAHGHLSCARRSATT